LTLPRAGRSLGVVVPKLALSIAVLLAAATPAAATMDVFHQWRMPDGSIYIGETPPEGSVLVRRIELPTRDAAAAEEPGEDLARAAEDGREVIRRREAAREAARDREVTRAVREREVLERVPETVIVDRWIPLRQRRRHDDRDRDPRLGIGPNPLPRVVRPDTSWKERRLPPLRPSRGRAARSGS
jgi:hypothetical protein